MVGVAVMVKDKYAVRLQPEQREELQHLIRVGESSARVTARARILLKSDDGWAAPRWRKPWMWRWALCIGSSSALLGRGWRGPCGTGPRPTGIGSWMTGARRTWSLWPAAQRRRDMTTGPCACWPGRWWNWGWRPPCPMRECVSGSKKRS